MKQLTFLLLMFFISSCASEKKPKFVKESVCSDQALKYLKNPRNYSKQALSSPQLIQAMTLTSKNMQSCYEDFKYRTGNEEFNTCLVVGVNEMAEVEFFNFGTKEVNLDQKFINCAQAVTQSVPFHVYGTNYILIQAYQFYVGEI
jgi:hypothetical protein